MSTPTITDEQIDELEGFLAEAEALGPMTDCETVLALISRLRAAEERLDAYERALLLIENEVDGNIRPTVRDLINGMPDANDIYGYCEEIDRLIDAAMNQPEPNHPA